METNEQTGIVTMSFDEMLQQVGAENIFKYFPELLSRGQHGVPYSENKFFDLFVKALSVDSDYEIARQYSVDNGRFYIDCLLSRERTSTYEDGSKDKNLYCVMIEYDEKYHRLPSQKEKDEYREKEITKYFQRYAKGKGYDNISLEIVRINEGQEHLAFLYLLPFLAGIDTSYCGDKVKEYLDYRILIFYDL